MFVMFVVMMMMMLIMMVTVTVAIMVIFCLVRMMMIMAFIMYFFFLFLLFFDNVMFRMQYKNQMRQAFHIIIMMMILCVSVELMRLLSLRHTIEGGFIALHSFQRHASW